jgi:hypothetical protein
VIDDAAVTKLLANATLSAAEATAIVRIGELAAGVDLDEDDEEYAALDALEGKICALAGVDPDSVPAVSPLPLDDEERRAWCKKLCAPLASMRAKELAYEVAYLVIVSDLQLAREESQLLDDLAAELGLDSDRVGALDAAAGELVTPDAE